MRRQFVVGVVLVMTGAVWAGGATPPSGATTNRGPGALSIPPAVLDDATDAVPPTSPALPDTGSGVLVGCLGAAMLLGGTGALLSARLRSRRE